MTSFEHRCSLSLVVIGWGRYEKKNRKKNKGKKNANKKVEQSNDDPTFNRNHLVGGNCFAALFLRGSFVVIAVCQMLLVVVAGANDALPLDSSLSSVSRRSLASNWCILKPVPTTANPIQKHTLPRGSKCIMTTDVILTVGKSLELSSSIGDGEMAVLSGGNPSNFANPLFFVNGGELTVIELILEDTKSIYDGGAIMGSKSSSKTRLIRSIVRNCESKFRGGALFANSVSNFPCVPFSFCFSY
jgi:hypothetical protein